MLLSAVLGVLPWENPTLEDFQQLSEASEYAAWTLVNGCALNHTTISVHNLAQNNRLDDLVEALQRAGFELNGSGGLVKKSPDGGLLQASTVADTIAHAFREGQAVQVPGSYIEFAERLVLPEHRHLGEEEVKECHRRDGFEAGNADKIFESTTLASQ